MLPQGVHFIASPIMAILMVALIVATKTYWGGGWRIGLALAVGFVPTFVLAHLIAEPLFRVLVWLTERRERGRDAP